MKILYLEYVGAKCGYIATSMEISPAIDVEDYEVSARSLALSK